MVESSLQFHLFEDKRKRVMQRMEWNNQVLNMLEERKKNLLMELRLVNGQIESVKEDKASLWEIINQTNEVPEVSESI